MTIYLYIKQCTHCELKYFGKTTKNPYSYKGSGKYWLRHLKSHGVKPETLEIYTFDNENEPKTFALMFSEYNCIVESKLWANLKPENALDGFTPGVKHSFETKEKISKSLIGQGVGKGNGKKLSKEAKEKMSISRKGKPSHRKGKKVSQEQKAKLSKTLQKHHYRSKKWIIIYPDGSECEILSLNKFCKENDLNQGNLHKTSTGKQKHHKGFKCKPV